MSARLFRSLVMVAVGAATLALPAQVSAAPSCAATWGSLAKAHATTSSSLISLTRTGRHDCYDRVVFEFEGGFDGYRIEYVDQVVPESSEEVLPVAGGAKLQVTLVAGLIDDTSRWTYSQGFAGDHVADVAGYQTLRDLVVGGSSSIGHDSEWHTTFGIGVRARLPFRAFVLPGPGTHSRLVVDIAHRW